MSEKGVQKAARIDRSEAGPGALRSRLKCVGRMGLTRGVRARARLSQVECFYCPGCAWRDASPRHTFEFCENGAKVVAHEATPKRVGRDFFERWSVAELAAQDD